MLPSAFRRWTRTSLVTLYSSIHRRPCVSMVPPEGDQGKEVLNAVVSLPSAENFFTSRSLATAVKRHPSRSLHMPITECWLLMVDLVQDLFTSFSPTTVTRPSLSTFLISWKSTTATAPSRIACIHLIFSKHAALSFEERP